MTVHSYCIDPATICRRELGCSGLGLGNAFCICQYAADFVLHLEVLCPELAGPVNGNVSLAADAEDRLTGARFTCAAGYILWGPGQLTCRLGRWSAEPPTCKILNCGSPPEVTYLSYLSHIYTES